MGVKELWPLLSSVRTNKSFEDIKGETVAIDLSMWIVDSQCVKQMSGTVTRPHLRNLFFRTSALLQADILPVFVIEGDAPELKWQTMAERQKQRHGKQTSANNGKLSARTAKRSHFKAVIKECCEMLDYLGVPCVQSCGEAEAMCAALNSHGLVDAVITDDGDAFLYGAPTVYRNFTTTKAPSVDSYRMEDINSRLGLSRNHLIALALLIGCDYCPKGVPGVGKTQAIKLCTDIDGGIILTRLLQWSGRGLRGDEDSAEKSIAMKICKMKSSNFPEIVEEFTSRSYKLPSQVGSWRKPLISRAQNFNEAKMDWPTNYSLEKMLPLLTLWSFTHVTDTSMLTIHPEQIVKKRVRHGVESLEVLWSVNDPYHIEEEDVSRNPMVTVESLKYMERCFPIVVQTFINSKAAKTKRSKKAAKCKPTPTPNDLSNQCNELPTVSDRADCNKKFSDLSDASCLSLDGLHLTSDYDIGSDVVNKPTTDARMDDSAIYLYDSFAHKIKVTGVTASGVDGPTLSEAAASLDSSHHQPCNQDSVSPFNDSFDDSSDTSILNVNNSTYANLVQMKDEEFKLDKHTTDPLVCKRKQRDSLDQLLADISEHLKTPNKCDILKEVNNWPSAHLDVSAFDGIITGHITPDGHLGNSDYNRQLNCSQTVDSGSPNLTKPLVEMKSALTDSELSLFSLNMSGSSELCVTPLQGNSKPLSLTKSTPLESAGRYCHLQDSNSDSQQLCATYGEFDLVPKFSSVLSFTD